MVLNFIKQVILVIFLILIFILRKYLDFYELRRLLDFNLKPYVLLGAFTVLKGD
jgi:hypothetical protein